MKRGLRSVVCAALMLLMAASAPAGEKTIGVWMSPGGPPGVWEKSYGDPFPVKMIVKDLWEMGISDVFFFEQSGRGGPFLHPTQVQYAKTDARMKGRDFLKDLLEETGKYDIKVWLAWKIGRAHV